MTRLRWEAEVLAVAIVGRLGEALAAGGGGQAPDARGAGRGGGKVAALGRNQRVSAQSLLKEMGAI